MIKIIKRNGDKTDFDKNKIKNAILKSMKYGSGIVKEHIAVEIAEEIEMEYMESKEVATVSKVENTVYNKLIEKGVKETAKKYEGYRVIQSFKRQTNTSDEDILGIVKATNAETLEENSNKNAKVASTQRDLIAGEVSKDIARRKIIPTKFVQALDEGAIHWHR